MNVPQITLRVPYRSFAAFDAQHASALRRQRGQRQREQTRTGIQIPQTCGFGTVKLAAYQIDHMVGQSDRRMPMHLPETACIHVVFEFTAGDNHLFRKLTASSNHLAVHKHGVIV